MKHYKESEKKHQPCVTGFLWSSEQHYPGLLKAHMTVASNPGTVGPEARQAAGSTLTSEASQHSSLQLCVCFTLNHHCLRDARSTCGSGVRSVTSCTFSTLSAVCSSRPACLCKVHTQPTYPTHNSEFQSGQGLEVHCCKDNSFFGFALRWGQKGYRRRASTGQKAICFPTTSFYLLSEVTFSSPVILLPSSHQRISNFVSSVH